MQGLVLKIRAWWNIADKTAKAVTIVGVLFLIVVLVATFVLASQPDYVVLYADLSTADSGKVINKLKDMKVPFRIGGDGATIEVPKRQRDEVRMKLAAEGLPVEESGLGNGWLSKSSITTTQEQERQIRRIMLEEELQKTIRSLRAVEGARVHLTFGEEGPFADQQRKASASVVLHTRPDMSISPEEVSAVVHIVSRSVTGLDPKNVSVVDGGGAVLYDGEMNGPGGAGVYAVKRREELAFAADLRREFERHLEKVLGPGKSVVNVQCTMNFDSEESEKTVNTPSSDKNVISDASAESTYANGANVPGGVVGATANTPGAAGGTATTSGNGRAYTESKKVTEYAFDRDHIKTVKAPGKIESLNVSLLLDRSVNQAQVAAVTEYVNGALGIRDPASPPPGHSVLVSQAEFDEEAAKQAKNEAGAMALGERLDRYLRLIPSVALIIAAVLVMRALGRQSIRIQGPLAALKQKEGAPAQPAERHVEPTAEAPAPEPSTAASRAQAQIHVEPIPAKFDVTKEQIVRMVYDQPGTVAMLVKSWMMEDRG